MTLVIDATDQVLGRLASYAAKRALLGEEVIILNAEKALISGKRHSILREYLEKYSIRNIGNPRKGPFHQKGADRFVRRAIRGMLPIKQPRGREAYKRVMVYVGVPKWEIKRRHNIDLNSVEVERPAVGRKELESYITVGELCKQLGARP